VGKQGDRDTRAPEVDPAIALGGRSRVVALSEIESKLLISALIWRDHRPSA